MQAQEETNLVTEIHSGRLSFSGSGGLAITAYLDSGPSPDLERVVILAPRYGETKKNNLRFAYFLAANGLPVLRFDHTNHVGESEGEMEQYTLPGATEDIIAAVRYARRELQAKEVIVMAVSLSARCALRAAATEPGITRLISLVGVVNLTRTLREIYDQDIIGISQSNPDWGIIDILGFDINSIHFSNALVESDMHDVQGAIKDARKLSIPFLHLHAENDRWVSEDEARAVMEAARGRFETVPGALHEVGENPEATRLALGTIRAFCLEGSPLAKTPIREPDRRSLLEQNRREREALRSVYSDETSEGEFWEGYLGKFSALERADYYRNYFQTLSELLGEVNKGEILVDAGCGNGFLGMNFLDLLEQRRQAGHDAPGRLFYLGMDLTAEGLDRAYERILNQLTAYLDRDTDYWRNVQFAYRRFDFDHLGGGPDPVDPAPPAEAAPSGRRHDPTSLLSQAFARVAFETGPKPEGSRTLRGDRIPLADGSVDKICRSLVLSYLVRPVDLLREFHRLLRPGGVAVVSTMKPDCDLTVLFHEFLQSGASGEEKADARSLLGAAGKIRHKEQLGIYGFFSMDELQELAEEAGFETHSTHRSLSNQANVIRLER